MLTGLAGIFVLGIGAQWLAWKLKLPSILLLLFLGFMAGPVSGWLRPDEMFGELLFPIVSLSVALILFEGSLGLKLADIRDFSRPLRNLLTTGVLVTWIVVSIAAWTVLRMEFAMSLLLGAMLTVTGPTVVGPLLRHIRPTGRTSPIARWEGIVVDPIGAVLAVLVFEAIGPIREAAFGAAVSSGLIGLLKTTTIGLTIGGGVAWLLSECLKRHWIPDHLQSPVALMMVGAAFAASNLLQHEAGLLTVTVMGLVLANRKSIDVRSILEFKENLSVLLISSLFILLAARVEWAQFSDLGWRGPAFVAVVILIARPASVLISTIGTDLTWNERAFLSWLAPRGIVAAAVASVFELRLGEGGTGLVSATFCVIVGTVVVYGLTAFPLARRLKLATSDPQGLLIASAHPGARAMAHAVSQAGFRVILIDFNHWNINQARLEGLEARYANILSDQVLDDFDLGGIGRFLALTSNDEVNSLAAMHFSELFSRAGVYQLPPVTGESHRWAMASALFRGRRLFSDQATFGYLDKRFEANATVKTVALTEQFDFEMFQQKYGPTALPLFVITDARRLQISTADKPLVPLPGQKLIALVNEAVPDAVQVTDATAGDADHPPAPGVPGPEFDIPASSSEHPQNSAVS